MQVYKKTPMIISKVKKKPEDHISTDLVVYGT